MLFQNNFSYKCFQLNNSKNHFANQIITSVEDAGLFQVLKNNIGEPPNHIQSG